MAYRVWPSFALLLIDYPSRFERSIARRPLKDVKSIKHETKEAVLCCCTGLLFLSNVYAPLTLYTVKQSTNRRTKVEELKRRLAPKKKKRKRRWAYLRMPRRASSAGVWQTSRWHGAGCCCVERGGIGEIGQLRFRFVFPLKTQLATSAPPPASTHRVAQHELLLTLSISLCCASRPWP